MSDVSTCSAVLPACGQEPRPQVECRLLMQVPSVLAIGCQDHFNAFLSLGALLYILAWDGQDLMKGGFLR